MNYLFSIVSNLSFDYAFHGLTAEKYIAIRRDLMKYKTKTFFSKTSDPFLLELRNELLTPHSFKRYRILLAHYKHILTELYETRNSIIHSNMVEPAAKIKIQKTAPLLLKQLRYGLFDLISLKPKLDFSAIINTGIARAKKLTAG